MIKVFRNDFNIHSTPLEKIYAQSGKVTVELDDINENRYIVEFAPCHAIKVTTLDCVPIEYYFTEECIIDGKYNCNILELTDSPWISHLRNGNENNDLSFLTNSTHYILPLRDNIIEVVSTTIKISRCE